MKPYGYGRRCDTIKDERCFVRFPRSFVRAVKRQAHVAARQAAAREIARQILEP